MAKRFDRLSKFEFSDPYFLRKISPHVRKTLVEHRARIYLIPGTTGMAYSREKPKHKMYFEKGYDILQYNIVVREYILRRYQIKKDIELDILLYLFPFHFFTREDFMVLPTRSRGYNMKKMVNLGFIKIYIKKASNDKAGHIYALTKQSKEIVRNYYKYLSGEKTLKPDNYKNPFRGADTKKIDRDREALMFKLAKQIEKNPNNFTDSF